MGGKGKDHAKKGKGGGGREKKYRDEEEDDDDEEEEQPKGRVGKQPDRGMPPSDDDDEEEEEPPRKGGGQSANAGMMPPSDDSDDSDSDDDDPPPTPKEMAEFIKSKGLGKEFMTWLAKKRKEAKAAPKAMPGYEMSRKDQEAAKKKKEEEEEEEEEVDPAVAKRLEEVRKRREAQAKQRIASDGYDRMKPLSADNHPPDMSWPPPNQKVADVS